jgi:hypothetical protein
LAVRQPGGVPPPGSGPGAPENPQTAELKARNAAGKQARSAPRADFQRPHRVHGSAERRVAFQRKHAEELAEEARRHMVHFKDEADPNAAIDGQEENERLMQAVTLDEERKKGKQRQQQQQDQDAPDQESQEEIAAKSMGFTEGSGKYFQDLPEDRLGDLTLTDPNDIKRQLGPAVRFAQHAMLLAEAKVKEGQPRSNALEFLASLYLGVADRAYANKALRDFGPATGIIDLYPLEVMKHLLEHVPSFLTKVTAGTFLASRPVEGYKGKAGTPIILKYDADLRIRGFAIKGGAKPGYLLEPIDPPGTYQLTFATPGSFVVILSAMTKNGQLCLEEFAVEVAPGDTAALEDQTTMQKTRASVADTEPPPPSGGAAPAPGEEKPQKPKQDLKLNIPRKI